MQKLSLAALQPVRVFFFTGFLQGCSASSGCEEKKKKWADSIKVLLCTCFSLFFFLLIFSIFSFFPCFLKKKCKTHFLANFTNLGRFFTLFLFWFLVHCDFDGVIKVSPPLPPKKKWITKTQKAKKKRGEVLRSAVVVVWIQRRKTKGKKRKGSFWEKAKVWKD